MHSTLHVRGLTVILAGYAAGAAWFWLDAGLPRVTASTDLTNRVSSSSMPRMKINMGGSPEAAWDGRTGFLLPFGVHCTQ
jgi:hypothetical protein